MDRTTSKGNEAKSKMKHPSAMPTRSFEQVVVICCPTHYQLHHGGTIITMMKTIDIITVMKTVDILTVMKTVDIITVMTTVNIITVVTIVDINNSGDDC